MGKQILLGIGGVILGIIFGMIVMMGLHAASWLVYPVPDDVSMFSQDPENLEKMRAWMNSLPAGAFLLATLAHGLGAMSGAAVAMLVSGRRALWPAIVIGGFFTVGGIMNLSSIPHPSWFPFVDLPIYLLLALVAGVLLKRSANEPVPVYA